MRLVLLMFISANRDLRSTGIYLEASKLLVRERA